MEATGAQRSQNNEADEQDPLSGRCSFEGLQTILPRESSSSVFEILSVWGLEKTHRSISEI